jgi:hypothetical protein
MAVLCAAGCGSREGEIPGLWLGSNLRMVTTPGHNYIMTLANGSFRGTWESDQDGFKFDAMEYDQELIPQVLRWYNLNRDSMKPAERQFYEDLNQPHYFVLSDDGKQLVTDKRRHWNGFTSIRLEKIGD